MGENRLQRLFYLPGLLPPGGFFLFEERLLASFSR